MIFVKYTVHIVTWVLLQSLLYRASLNTQAGELFVCNRPIQRGLFTMRQLLPRAWESVVV